MYQLRILESAITELSDLDQTIAKRIVKRMNWLAEHFDQIRPEILTADLTGFYKLRVGDYRVIYEVFTNEQYIVIHKIGHRRKIYQ